MLARSQPRKRIFQFALDASSDRDTIKVLQKFYGCNSAGEYRDEVLITAGERLDQENSVQDI